MAGSHLKDPSAILNDISVAKYLRQDYQDLYKMSGEPLWDPNKDWIRTVDWDQVRQELSGTTVRFAVGAADAESAKAGLAPFEAISGITVELVPIPDDNIYDKVLAVFLALAGRFCGAGLFARA
jgi:multiple sugar transport system substrate-binding protein